jgi:hypothetical protein
MSKFIIPILLLADGMVVTLAATFAPDIGIDPNEAWGRSRYMLLSLGLLLISISLLAVFFQKKRTHFLESVMGSETSKTLFVLGHVWVVIIMIYAGFITFGNFTTWNHTTHYYTQLADAFSKGNLYVDRRPGNALLNAPDPNDPINRPPVDDEIWDMSLYKGKLYLYWGPVPALLLMPIQLIADKKITDNYLVFVFFAGLLIFNSLIILRLWKKFFTQIPAIYVFVCIPLIGLILPITWSTGIPNVYEAAIGAGQFFLVGGIYFSLSAFEQYPSFDKKSLFLAGVFWACSVGSRAINAWSVIFLTSAILVWILATLPKPTNLLVYFRCTYSLLIPLITGALMIGWYNWARFDSPFEFGFRYQITIFNLNEQADLVFKPGYFFLNLYAYIFNPYEIISKFPFIRPTIASDTLRKLNIVLPEMHHAGRIPGLLFSAPFLVLSLVHLFQIKKVKEKDLSVFLQPCNFVVILLTGSFFANFAGILFLFFAQTRYLVDAISQVTLLAIIEYWQIVSRKLTLNSIRSKLLLAFANLLIVLTICAGVLLTFSSETGRFETLNPQLFEKINEFLSIQKIIK